MRIKHYHVFLGVVLVLLFVVMFVTTAVLKEKTTTKTQAAPAGFVTRSGKTLLLNGAPYKFVGFNAYGMTGCETGSVWTNAQIDAYFNSLPPASMTRIWAFKQRSSNLDYVVQSAAAHNQKLVMTLGNGLRNCENGTFYFVTGSDPGDTMGTAWFQSGYKGAWMDWVRTAVGKYKNSPAVGMWEVSNEGGHHGSASSDISVSIMKPYYDDVSAVIKGIDSQHLVSTGALAEYTYGGVAGYQSIHSSANIDVVSFHEYDGGTISNHFSAVMGVANALNKPLMVGETGQPWGSITSGQSRADYLKKRFDAYLSQGASGVLPWNYGQGNYGGWTIFPGDATATMVSNYKIAGIVVSPMPTSVPTSTPKPTVKPTAILTAIPTIPSTPTKVSFTLLLHGLGTGGDNSNPKSLGNSTLVRPQRTITVEIYNSQGQLILTKPATVTFTSATGVFKGTLDLGTTFPSGVYQVKVKSAQYLRMLIPGIQQIVAGKDNQLAQTALIVGDVTGDNVLDLLDYNIILGCYSDLLPAVSCTATNKQLADLTDDGSVNQSDYNLFLREFSNRQGQ